MTIQEYINIYDSNKELFNKFFGQNSQQYWKIWKLHNVDGVSYDKLAHQYNYSKSTIKNINDRVKDFLDNPEIIDKNKDFKSKLSEKPVMYPNEFMRGKVFLSSTAHKLWLETIYLYQNFMKLEIPRHHILDLSPQYKNIDRRTQLFEELRQLKIKIDDKKEVQAFNKIIDNKVNMEFEFSDDCLDYIDIFRRILNHFSLSTD